MSRFSIAALMLAVLICALAVPALKQASDVWAGAVLMLTILLLGGRTWARSSGRVRGDRYGAGLRSSAGAI